MTSLSKPEEILKKYWGFPTFRSLQKEIIEDVLTGKDVVALLPTGGGKSICFQVPALGMPGICLVVSPLIALMEDQVKALQIKGIKAMALTGGIPYTEVDTMLDNCIYGNYKFLYLSPERLQQELVQERIRQMPVNLIAIDEAHCISQWGHDFRPAYGTISLIRKIKPEAPLIGLTATATPEVLKDIADQLELSAPVIHQKSFARENLAYLVQEVQDKKQYLEQLLKEHNESAIIYVRSRKATGELVDFLEKKGITASSFHGGLQKKDKSERLRKWLKNEIRVMVATSAFGMGIDKPDVRTVIHIHLPESMESYFQEAGRAGRDGNPAKAVILTNRSDISLLKNQFLHTLPSVDFVKLVYRKLVTYFRIAFGEGEGTEHHFNFHEFCHHYQLNVPQAYNAILFLDRSSVLQLSEQFQKKTKIRFTISGRQLTFYLEENPQFEAVVKAILRTYGGVFDNLTEINLQTVCSKAGTNQPEAVKLLQQLNAQNLAEFEHDQHDTRIAFLVPREDDSTINPLVPHIKLQLRSKKEKIDQVLDYVANNSKCKSEQLLQYFGEKNTRPCGNCSVCNTREQKLSRDEMKTIYFKIVSLLQEEEQSAQEITEQLDFSERHILYVLQVLVDREALRLTTNGKYKLKHL